MSAYGYLVIKFHFYKQPSARIEVSGSCLGILVLLRNPEVLIVVKMLNVALAATDKYKGIFVVQNYQSSC